MIEGPVTNLTKFGAFVQLTEGVEGMIHVSEISAEKRINHPQEVLRAGQVVKAQVLALDTEKRLIRLSMKQLVPTGLDEYLAEHKEGDIVTGRMIEVSEGTTPAWNWAKASWRLARFRRARGERRQALRSVASVVSFGQARSFVARFHVAGTAGRVALPTNEAKPEAMRAGQVRKFRITNLDPATKKIELELE